MGAYISVLFFFLCFTKSFTSHTHQHLMVIPYKICNVLLTYVTLFSLSPCNCTDPLPMPLYWPVPPCHCTDPLPMPLYWPFPCATVLTLSLCHGTDPFPMPCCWLFPYNTLPTLFPWQSTTPFPMSHFCPFPHVSRLLAQTVEYHRTCYCNCSNKTIEMHIVHGLKQQRAKYSMLTSSAQMAHAKDDNKWQDIKKPIPLQYRSSILNEQLPQLKPTEKTILAVII